VTTAHEIAGKKLSVRDAEKLVNKQLGAGRQSPLLRVKGDKSRDVLRLEEELSDLLTAQLEIRVKKRTKRGEQGELAIQFGSLEELNGLIDKLRGGPQA
jgi:ParB family chromosome partitioning protein